MCVANMLFLLSLISVWGGGEGWETCFVCCVFGFCFVFASLYVYIYISNIVLCCNFLFCDCFVGCVCECVFLCVLYVCFDCGCVALRLVVVLRLCVFMFDECCCYAVIFICLFWLWLYVEREINYYDRYGCCLCIVVSVFVFVYFWCVFGFVCFALFCFVCVWLCLSLFVVFCVLVYM